MRETIEYRYRPRLLLALFNILLFGAFVPVVAHSAMTNEASIRLFGVIILPPNIATGFLWFLTVFGIAFIAFSFILMRMALSPKRRIVLSQHELALPLSLFHDRRTAIPLDSITRIGPGAGKPDLLIVWHEAGKAPIQRRLFESQTHFDDLVEQLKTYVIASQ